MSRLALALAPTAALFVLGCQSSPPAPAPKTVSEPTAEAAPAAAEPRDWKPTIDAALIWLALHQDEDGKWDADDFMKHDRAGTPCDGPGNGVHDCGATGLAMLCMLGHGSTLQAGPHQDSLRRACDWLADQQQESGLFGVAASHDFVYDHAIATFAICEAYGISRSETLKPVAQKALDYLERHRNPYAVWRYQPRDNDNDTSVTTWASTALLSGKHFGLKTNPQAFSCIAQWYDAVTDENGRAGYTKAGEPSSRKVGDHVQRFPPEKGEAMTAAALFVRYFLGQTPEQKPVMAKAAQILANNPPRWERDRIDPYYWYFGTQACYQAGGETWAKWRRGFASIADAQRTDGNFSGSWDPVGVWDEDGGRVYATALYTLCLSADQRYQQVVRKKDAKGD